MNCNDIDRILNEEDVATLGVAERAAVTSHVATCRDCALEWQAFNRLVTAAVPQIPDDLPTRCRTRFVATARANAVRTATRPLLVGLFVGAAAAALVGAQFFGDGGDRGDFGPEDQSPLQPPAATSPLDSTGLDTPQAVVSDGAAAASAAPAQGAATAALPEPRSVASPDTFVLAVSELKRDRVIDAGALAVVEAVYAEIVRQLRTLPTITVLTVEANTTASRTLNVFDLGASEVRLGQGADGAGTSTRTVQLLVGSFDPSTRLRTETVAGGASPGSGPDSRADVVVNRILDANVRGMRFDVPGSAPSSGGAESGSSDAADSRAPATASATPAFDYRLDFEATSAVRNGDNEWTLSYRGTGKAAVPTSSSTSAPVASGLDPASVATRIVEALRNTVLPADPTWIETLRSRMLDPRLTPSARLEALNRLTDLRGRTALEGRDTAVVEAALELALTTTVPTERARVWQLLRGAKNAVAVPALASSLLTDLPAARIEALRTLASDFAGNASARAALEQAALSDATAQIRLEATWALRDAAGRDRYVRDTLLDERLSNEERLAPLLFALDQPAEVDGNPSDSGIDDAAAAALVTIVDRAATVENRRGLLVLLARVEHAALTDAYLDFLRDAPDERTRVLAVNLLVRRLNDPRVRAALESHRYDGSERVRTAVTRALDRP